MYNVCFYIYIYRIYIYIYIQYNIYIYNIIYIFIRSHWVGWWFMVQRCSAFWWPEFGTQTVKAVQSKLSSDCELDCPMYIIFSHGTVFEVKWIQPKLPNLIVPHAQCTSTFLPMYIIVFHKARCSR